MVLATIISKYLQENRRLVIPQLGAFLVKEPGHTVLFSQLLTKDDGVLQNLLVESGMSDVEASGAISRLLFDIRFVSENGGEYWITGVGHFSKGENGALRFEFDPATTPSASYSCDQEEEKTEEAEEQIGQTVQDASTEEVTTAEPEQSHEEVKETEEKAIETADEPIEPTEEEATPEELPAPAEQPAEQLEETEPQQETTQNPPQAEPSLEAAPEEYRHIHFEPDPDLEGLSYGGNGKRSKRRHSTPSKKLDWWMIIAVSAALLALSVILYGFLREGAQQGSPIAARVEQRAK